ncbi:MAG: hypothetical protein BalsKO_02520 [Balneolaceae bacterium]
MKEKAQIILESRLTNNFYSRFSIGDTIDFYFDGFMLIAQDIQSDYEKDLNKIFKENYKFYDSSIDKENMSKSSIIASAMRQPITKVELQEEGTLILVFKNEIQIVLLTSTRIVDWQWALNKDGRDPNWGNGYEVCCFFKNDVRVNEY